jgi:mono/diheme cytochrome c family protein
MAITAGLMVVVTAASAADSAAAPDPAGIAFFETKVRPLFVQHCHECHAQGAKTREGGLLVDSREALVQGGDSGPAIVPGDPDRSLLIRAVRHTDDDLKMPPEQPLAAADIAVLEQWVRIGAPFPKPLDATADPTRADHWSFQPLQKVEPPTPKDAVWARTPIDRFIRAAQESGGVDPSPPADRRTLARRLYFDLLGLPPTPEEVDAFVNDPAQDAYEKLVDSLLANPHFGERWGRHWLDVARYADSSGYSVDSDREFAYQYRDFVIRAFNQDLPYDRFVRWQIAGDLIAADDPEAIRATGFCTAGPFNTNKPLEKDRWDELDDIVSTTGLAMLGLTTGCARCHSHKYDPISMRDYYRLAGAFASSKREDRPVADGKAHALSDTGIANATGWLLARGNHEQKTEKLPAGFIQSLSRADDSRWLSSGKDAVHPRVALANWIIDVEAGAGPLAARVAVNRLWQHHFGRGLVGTPNDFGAQGERPTHPELLEWLAGELVQGGWSLRTMHRLMLNSAVYRQASAWDEARAARDPENRLLWTRRPVRHETEVVRDAILAVSGGLNGKMFGPGVKPPIHPDAILPAKFATWPMDIVDGPDLWRRSVYVFGKRSVPVPMLQVFDAAEASGSVGRRAVTTVAPQALALMNEEFVRGQAVRMAARVVRDAGPEPAEQIGRAWRLAYSRPPTPAERDLAVRFLAKHQGEGQATADAAAPTPRPLVDLCHGLLLSNEFVYVD